MSKRPNVIVVLTDQQRWDTVGAHGNPMGLTPTFDRLARTGLFVMNSFTCQPVCGPARSAFQTGRFPTQTGCYRNSIPLPRSERTLAHHFGDAGYRTGYIGKWHLAENEPVPPEERGGYQDWLGSNLLEFTSYPFDTVVYDGDGNEVKLPGYRVDALTDAAIRYIDGQKNNPFFLFLSYLEPHHQNQTDDYPAPLGYEETMRERLDVPQDLATLGGIDERAPAWLSRHGEAARRGLRPPSRGAAQSQAPQRHHHPVHVRSRLPLQDAKRRVQALLPRGVDPGANPVPWAGFREPRHL